MTPERRATYDILIGCMVWATIITVLIVEAILAANEILWPLYATVVTAALILAALILHTTWTQKVHKYRREEEERP